MEAGETGAPWTGEGVKGNIAGHIKSAYALCRKVCSCFLLPSNPRVEKVRPANVF